MSVLLRNPAAVPALFSRAMDADLGAAGEGPLTIWRRVASSNPLLAVAGWAAIMLIDIPLVKAATAIASRGSLG